MVTHRLSTLEPVDRIAVRSQGGIVDVGTRDQLIKRCELYRALRCSKWTTNCVIEFVVRLRVQIGVLLHLDKSCRQLISQLSLSLS